MMAFGALAHASHGLVSWWPAEESANDARDGNHGTLMNGVTFALGKVGQAFSLDGVNDSIRIPHSSQATVRRISQRPSRSTILRLKLRL